MKKTSFVKYVLFFGIALMFYDISGYNSYGIFYILGCSMLLIVSIAFILWKDETYCIDDWVTGGFLEVISSILLTSGRYTTPSSQKEYSLIVLGPILITFLIKLIVDNRKRFILLLRQ